MNKKGTRGIGALHYSITHHGCWLCDNQPQCHRLTVSCTGNYWKRRYRDRNVVFYNAKRHTYYRTLWLGKLGTKQEIVI